MGYWWCNNCQMELDNSRVRFDETCDFCGYNVEWRVIVTIKEHVGEHELDSNWYKCPNCSENNIAEQFNYCPMCGVKIDWQW